ncbi:efflux RND transporter periplasmic adaptor subunit [candidate division KSB1 bacterium]|nr:efflux RND transporter periplasmic adaptor subunit [candidate division KSB1 bacterium]
MIGIPVVITGLLMMSGCTKEQTQAKSMEQLHEENGIPVRVESVVQKPLTSEHTYFAVLTGILESTASAHVGDKVDKILYRVGDSVQKDAVVITFPTDNPAAQYYQAKVGYEHAEATVKRMENLFNNGGISQQEYENARTQYMVSKANWDAVKQAVKVQAPISGTITSINVQESDNVHSGDALFTISQTSKLKAKLWVPESQIHDVAIGNPTTATWNGITLEGTVTQVDMSLNTKQQAFGVAVEFENPDQKVMSGVNAEIEIIAAANRSAVVIERKNIVMKDNRAYVFVADKGAAVAREITIGKELGLDVEVKSGLRPGDSLITEGQMLLSNGTKINIIKN